MLILAHALSPPTDPLTHHPLARPFTRSLTHSPANPLLLACVAGVGSTRQSGNCLGGQRSRLNTFRLGPGCTRRSRRGLMTCWTDWMGARGLPKAMYSLLSLAVTGRSPVVALGTRATWRLSDGSRRFLVNLRYRTGQRFGRSWRAEMISASAVSVSQYLVTRFLSLSAQTALQCTRAYLSTSIIRFLRC